MYPATRVLLSHFPYAGDSPDEARYAQFRLLDEGIPRLRGHVHESFDFCNADDVDDGWALTRAMFASVQLGRRGLNALILASATDVGLTPFDIKQFESFGGDRAARTQIRMRRDLQCPSSIDNAGELHRTSVAAQLLRHLRLHRRHLTAAIDRKLAMTIIDGL